MSETWSERQGARMLRLAVIKNLYAQGIFDEATAIELLGGNLTPGDETTHVDDSALLHVTFEEAVKATAEPPACENEVMA